MAKPKRVSRDRRRHRNGARDKIGPEKGRRTAPTAGAHGFPEFDGNPNRLGRYRPLALVMVALVSGLDRLVVHLIELIQLFN